MSLDGIPLAMQWEIKRLKVLQKETVTMTPNKTQDVKPGQTIIVDLPYNSKCDLSTFSWFYDGSTTHKVLRGPRGGMILSKEKHAAAIDKAVFPGMQGGPIMSAVAGKAVVLKECATSAYQNYAKKVIENCQALANDLQNEGMRAVSGGTQTHLALIDIRSTGVNGKIELV